MNTYILNLKTNTMIKISLKLAIILNRTNKDFIFYNLSKNNIIEEYTLSNDYARNKEYKNTKYDYFKVISCIKPNIKTLNIEL